MEKKKNISKLSTKFTIYVVAAILLVVCLSITSFALIYSTVAQESNQFSTATVDINLNGGEKIVEENELYLSPGGTVEKNFYIQNDSTVDVYYRLYFENVTGDLSELVTVAIKNGDEIIISGNINELTRRQVLPANDMLKPSERRELTVSFTLPDELGNEYVDNALHFDLSADAVQAPNNPDMDFGN